MGLASGRPKGRNQPQTDELKTEENVESWREQRQIIHCQTKEVILVNEASIDESVSRLKMHFIQNEIAPKCLFHYFNNIDY